MGLACAESGPNDDQQQSRDEQDFKRRRMRLDLATAEFELDRARFELEKEKYEFEQRKKCQDQPLPEPSQANCVSDLREWLDKHTSVVPGNKQAITEHALLSHLRFVEPFSALENATLQGMLAQTCQVTTVRGVRGRIRYSWRGGARAYIHLTTPAMRGQQSASGTDDASAESQAKLWKTPPKPSGAPMPSSPQPRVGLRTPRH